MRREQEIIERSGSGQGWGTKACSITKNRCDFSVPLRPRVVFDDIKSLTMPLPRRRGPLRRRVSDMYAIGGLFLSHGH